MASLFPDRAAFWAAATRRLQVDVRYFARTSTILTLQYVLSVLSGLITGYLVARLLPPEAYGGYRFGLSVAGMVGLLTLAPLETAIAREIASRHEAAAVRFTLFWNAVMSLAGALLLLAFIPVLGAWWDQERLGSLFLVMALLFVPVQIGSKFFSAIVTGRGQFRQALWIKVASTAAVIVAVPLVLSCTHSLPALYATAVGLPALIVSGALFWQLRHYPSREKSWAPLRYGTLLSLNTIPVAMASQLDSFVIAALFGLKQLAIFQVSILVPEQAKAWFKSLLPAAFARLATMEDTRHNRRKLLSVVAGMSGVVAVGVILYAALAPILCAWLFPNYALAEVVWLSRLSAITLIAVPPLLLSQYLEAHGMIRSLQIANLGSAVVFVVMLLILTPTLGLTGAIIARAGMRLSVALLNILSLTHASLGESPPSPR